MACEGRGSVVNIARAVLMDVGYGRRPASCVDVNIDDDVDDRARE